jgi:hypothetical protein
MLAQFAKPDFLVTSTTACLMSWSLNGTIRTEFEGEQSLVRSLRALAPRSCHSAVTNDAMIQYSRSNLFVRVYGKDYTG